MFRSISNLPTKRSGLAILRRLVSIASDECCTKPRDFPKLADRVSPKERKCLNRRYQQTWIECPKPIIIKRPDDLGQIPFVKRKTKPRTASECIRLRDCDSVRIKIKPKCKYTFREKCDRIEPPCPSFSEILNWEPIIELTECDCLANKAKQLRFSYRNPCDCDPREPV